MAELRIAFIYNPRNPYLAQPIKRYNVNYRKFYFDALPQTPGIRVDFLGSETRLDFQPIKNNYDVWLFFEAIEWGIPPQMRGVEAIKGLRVCSIGDAHGVNKWSDAYRCTKLQAAERFGFDFLFYQHTHEWFRQFWPQEWWGRYWWIPTGFDPALYARTPKLSKRALHKVLLSGVYGLPYYPLRTKLAEMTDIVHYEPPGSYGGWGQYTPGKWDGDRFKLLLEQWGGAVASACTCVNKYWELPAAGCLTFAFVTEENGCRCLGFRDGETAVLVTLDNAVERIREFLACPNDGRWDRIAQAGRRFVHERYTYAACAERLVGKIKEHL